MTVQDRRGSETHSVESAHRSSRNRFAEFDTEDARMPDTGTFQLHPARTRELRIQSRTFCFPDEIEDTR
jgi:hypothetical protein